MSFLTSKQVFDQIFSPEETAAPDAAGASPEPESQKQKQAEPSVTSTPLAQFLNGLAGWLISQPGPLPQALGKHIREGKPLMVFSCREDVCSGLVSELYAQQIPYALLASPEGQYGFLVRSDDQTKTEEVQKKVLQAFSRRCEILTGEEIKRQTASSQDKSCIALCGLTLGQEEIFRKKFAQVRENAQLGVDRMADGTYTITLPTKDSIRIDEPESADVCRAWLETILSCGGPGGSRNEALAEYAFHLRRRLAQNFREAGVNLNKTPLWIVGGGKQYVKITANGFEYGHGVTKDQQVSLKPSVKIDITNPSYRKYLVSFVTRIPYAATTYDLNQAMLHLKRKKEKEKIDMLDLEPDAQQVIMARGEREMGQKIDRMIKSKIRHDPVMIASGHYNEKFMHYADEVKAFLKDLAYDRIPQGYSREEIADLRETMQRFGLDGEMYANTISEIDTLDIVEITDTIERISDIEEILEKEEEPEKEQERSQMRGSRDSRDSGYRNRGARQERSRDSLNSRGEER